eukprot:g82598.t1
MIGATDGAPEGKTALSREIVMKRKSPALDPSPSSFVPSLSASSHYSAHPSAAEAWPPPPVEATTATHANRRHPNTPQYMRGTDSFFAVSTPSDGSCDSQLQKFIFSKARHVKKFNRAKFYFGPQSLKFMAVCSAKSEEIFMKPWGMKQLIFFTGIRYSGGLWHSSEQNNHVFQIKN